MFIVWMWKDAPRIAISHYRVINVIVVLFRGIFMKVKQIFKQALTAETFDRKYFIILEKKAITSHM